MTWSKQKQKIHGNCRLILKNYSLFTNHLNEILFAKKTFYSQTLSSRKLKTKKKIRRCEFCPTPLPLKPKFWLPEAINKTKHKAEREKNQPLLSQFYATSFDILKLFFTFPLSPYNGSWKLQCNKFPLIYLKITGIEILAIETCFELNRLDKNFNLDF